MTQFDWEHYLILACSLALLVLGVILILFLGMQPHRAPTFDDGPRSMAPLTFARSIASVSQFDWE